VALGLRANGSALTTVPLLAEVTASGGSLAHVASGGGWQTTFTLVNTGTSSAQVQLSFFDNHGNPLLLPLTLVQPNTAVTTGSNTGPSVVGRRNSTTGNVGGFAIFRYTQQAKKP
jgi:hypothetical protein